MLKAREIFMENVEVSNNLFDGESLLESSFFPEDKGMLLLRNHMFKSAAFKCIIQKYLMDQCPKGVNYNEWRIPNMFNEPMLAKDIYMITTPSSLKALRFAGVWSEQKRICLIIGSGSWRKMVHCSEYVRARKHQNMA